ncbi:MAG: DnaD domain protein [Lachnospiraceae bacterium]|nr:DnaD domain protein [Lachnospiraceae bacterium]
MGNIRISTGRKFSATVVPNIFIDRYMASANGSFVKVYLYLLRCQSGSTSNFSISSAAEFLDETEKDIVRALKYWEKNDILVLEHTADEISGITILDLSQDVSCPAIVTAVPAVASVAEPVVEQVQEAKSPAARSYTRMDIEKALVNPDISWLSDIIGGYLEKLLTDADLSLIMFMYYDLHFSKELILHVYETCVSRNKKTIKYIQTVAINWFEQGITTVEEAEQNAIAFDAYFGAINKAWNLGRLPGDKEQKMIKSWKEMGFGIEVVKEACDRTLMSAGKPNFNYANKMLTSWHEKGLITLEQIKAQDGNGKTSAVKSEGTKSAQAYNNYASHTYSGMDMMEIQRQLLRKNKSVQPGQPK